MTPGGPGPTVLFARIVAAAAAGKILAWLLAGAPAGGDPPRLILVALVLVLSAPAVVLLVGGHRDPRATHLGAIFLATASTFSDWRSLAATGTWAGGAAVAGNLRLEALLPYLLWTFFAAFPRAPVFPRTRHLLLGLRLSLLALGTALLTASLILSFSLPAVSPAAGALAPLGALLDRGLGGTFWAVIAAASLPAPFYGLWTARWASPDERRRARLLMAALLLGVGPASAYLVLNGLAPTAAVLSSEAGITVVRAVVYPSLLALPFITAYTVLVHRALDVRLVIRKAVRYLLARWTLLVLVAAPLAASALLLWAGRERTLAQLFAGPEGPVLLGVLVLAAAALRVREPLLDRIDRMFFRETYDSHVILELLVERCRRAATVEDLAGVLIAGVDRALHPERVAVLALDPETGALVSGAGHPPPLAADSVLARRLARTGSTVRIDLEDDRSLASLPLEERHWLTDAGASLLVPLESAAGSLIGLVVLGERRSETPYTAEDRSLLASIASAASASLENHLLRGTSLPHPPSVGDDGSGTARECVTCGTLHPPAARDCSRCGSPLDRTTVPLVLAGRYHLDARIGAGGMGVVYRAEDTWLHRPVAIKTLPRMEPGRAARLRREARAMEVVAHPNLARLEGVESWRGAPFLIFEYLGGGTLADRVRRGPMHPDQVLELGMTLSEVTDVIHRVRILHRDIKPSNIGFDDAGTMKLLDFGLARVLDVAEEDEGEGGLSLRTLGSRTMAGAAGAAGPVGSVHYLSPEAARGAEPDPSFDLWSVAVVLFEALTGRKPVDGPTIPSILLRIVDGDLLPLERALPDPPRALRAFFTDCFSLDRGRRPGSAAELRERLRVLSMRLAA